MGNLQQKTEQRLKYVKMDLKDTPYYNVNRIEGYKVGLVESICEFHVLEEE
jgi:hypothetical protein